jgi:hypothetical protein
MGECANDLRDITGLDWDDMARAIPPTVCSAWVAPDGTWYYVPSCEHTTTATTMGTSAGSLESRGYIHLSLAYVVPAAIARIAHSATQAQVDAFFDAAMSVGDINLRQEFMKVVQHVISTRK